MAQVGMWTAKKIPLAKFSFSFYVNLRLEVSQKAQVFLDSENGWLGY